MRFWSEKQLVDSENAVRDALQKCATLNLGKEDTRYWKTLDRCLKMIRTMMEKTCQVQEEFGREIYRISKMIREEESTDEFPSKITGI